MRALGFASVVAGNVAVAEEASVEGKSIGSIDGRIYRDASAGFLCKDITGLAIRKPSLKRPPLLILIEQRSNLRYFDPYPNQSNMLPHLPISVAFHRQLPTPHPRKPQYLGSP